MKRGLDENRRRPDVQGIEEEMIRNAEKGWFNKSEKNQRHAFEDAGRSDRAGGRVDLIADLAIIVFRTVWMKMKSSLVKSQKNQTGDEYSNPFRVAEIVKSVAFHL